MIVPGMFVCSSFLISVCMFIVSKALLISSATVIVRAGGAIWLNPFATVLFSVCSAVTVECCVLYPCCMGVNPYSLARSYLCLLIHITLKNLMVSFSTSSLSNLYPFITSYSCMPSFICITSLHLSSFSLYRFDSNSTCSSVSTSPHPEQSSLYLHAILSLPLTGRHPPLTISLTLAPNFH